MARLPYLEADQVAPEYRDMLKRNTNLHKLLVNSPDMARAFNGIGGYIRFKSKLDPRLRELAILQVGWMERSEYEFTHHVKIGKEFGVTDEDIAGLMAETEGRSSKLEPLARAILKGAREMVRETRHVGGDICRNQETPLGRAHGRSRSHHRLLLRRGPCARDHEDRQRAVLQRGTPAVPYPGSELTCA
ncbi:carboxymuconolactone decarboxylase family protein [Bradyrhizobium guangxiense]